MHEAAAQASLGPTEEKGKKNHKDQNGKVSKACNWAAVIWADT